jgi:hypothetical protein
MIMEYMFTAVLAFSTCCRLKDGGADLSWGTSIHAFLSGLLGEL